MNLPIGATLGGYQIESMLGHGGMATVYRAAQSALNRMVALKVLPTHMARDPEFLTRFRREATVVAGLQHPNILPVYDFGEQDGVLYIVMMLVEGGTLESRLGQPLPVDTVLTLGMQLADALDYAHQRGVVHRDVKPANVLMGGAEWALLTDFGIARMLDEDSTLTQIGTAIGTACYMSPEQGQGLGIDGRSDLYSLGIVLHEMLTGRVPFKANTTLGTLQLHITAPIPSVLSVRPDVPPSLDAVITRVLSKSAAARYQRGSELKQALEEIRRRLVQQAASNPFLAVGDANAGAVPPAPPDRPQIAGLEKTVFVPPGTIEAAARQAQMASPQPLFGPGGNGFGGGEPSQGAANPLPVPQKMPVNWPVVGAAGVAALVLAIAAFVVLPGILSPGRNDAVASEIDTAPVETVTVSPPTVTATRTSVTSTPAAGTATAVATATAARTVTPTRVATRAATETVFEDSFRDGRAHAWSGPASQVYVQDNKLHVVATTPDRAYRTSPQKELQLTNFNYEATISRFPGADNRSHGLVFRFENGAYYIFAIYTSGSYYLSRYAPDRQEYIPIIRVADSSALNKGNTATNTLRVEANGSNLRLFANGQFLVEANDGTLPRGTIALWAGANDVHFAVSSVKVTR